MIPRNILKIFDPMPLTIKTQYNPNEYVHYKEEERNVIIHDDKVAFNIINNPARNL